MPFSFAANFGAKPINWEIAEVAELRVGGDSGATKWRKWLCAVVESERETEQRKWRGAKEIKCRKAKGNRRVSRGSWVCFFSQGLDKVKIIWYNGIAE